MIIKIRRAQSTLEYIILLAVVAAAIIGGGIVFKEPLKKAYDAVYPVNK
jgi:Flp pilus assembly pilin Flp